MTKAQLEELLNEPVISVDVVSGGDIAHAQRVDTVNYSYFVKSAQFPNAEELFEKEALGLKLLRESESIGIPKVLGTGTLEQNSYLLLEFIDSKPAEPKDMEALGRQLAQLHQAAISYNFGLPFDNFIGKLPQSNSPCMEWSSFYVKKRLMPQLRLAIDQNLLEYSAVPEETQLFKICSNLFGKITPALLHGDLWNGNYLISTGSKPYLIDPAVYYGHNEVDLAMTKLFGGFTPEFYRAYHEIIPPHQNQKELVGVYQLYYLLVHLNLFGSSYRNNVLRILNRYFK